MDIPVVAAKLTLICVMLGARDSQHKLCSLISTTYRFDKIALMPLNKFDLLQFLLSHSASRLNSIFLVFQSIQVPC